MQLRDTYRCRSRVGVPSSCSSLRVSATCNCVFLSVFRVVAFAAQHCFTACFIPQDAEAIGIPSSTIRDRWLEPRIVLALKRGGVADHATLLASLFLGFGLDAYVAYGSKLGTDGVETEYAWVVVLQESEVGGSTARALGEVAVQVAGLTRAVCWDPLTAERMQPGTPSTSGDRFWRVGCLFNHASFYGNVQEDDTVAAAHWDVADPSQWKALEGGHVAGIPRHARPTVLTPPLVNTAELAAGVESQVLDALAVHRHEHHAASLPVDRHMGYVLSPALAAYEAERLHGIAPDNADFAAAVRRYTPPGHTFKGCPVSFCHASPSRIVAALLRNPVAQDILATLGHDIAFALRVCITAYAEDTLAVWVLLAVRYQPHHGDAGDSLEGMAP